MKRPGRSTALLAALLGACSAAAPGDFEGPPVFTVAGSGDGSTTDAWRAAYADGRLLQAVFWTGPGIDGVLETTTHPPLWPLDTYRLDLFGDEGLPGPWAAGRYEIYVDDDGDGRLGPDEQAIGGLQFEGILFAARDLSADESPTDHPVPAGYHVVPFPMTCGARPAPTSTAPCDLPLGEACTPRSCAAGLCASKWPRQWSGPVCLVDGRAPACTPADATWVAGTERQVWVPACAADADCPGPDQTCAAALGGCLSSGPPLMWTRRRFEAVRLAICVDDP